VSVSVADVEPAVTVRPSAETMPDVTVGVPAASPSALPIATTESPASRAFELPNVTVGKLVAPSIRIKATSSTGLVPTNVAEIDFVVPLRVTVIEPPLTAAAMTWLFVTTSPFFEMIMPVPSSSSPLPVTSMLTVEGSTFWTSFGMFMLPPDDPVPGGALTWLMVTSPPLELEGAAKCPASPPTSAATTSSETRVDHSVRVLRTDESGTSSTIIELVEFGLRPVLSWSGSDGAFEAFGVSSNTGPATKTGAGVDGSSDGDDGVCSSCDEEVSESLSIGECGDSFDDSGVDDGASTGSGFTSADGRSSGALNGSSVTKTC
jgi:hypothetical protein